MKLPYDSQIEMCLPEGVRRLGFRKWYERELLSSHAHMVLAILAAIGMMASFETFHGATISGKLMNVLFVMVCALVGLWALRRYLFMLGRAEQIANQASCSSCSAYGRFDVVAEARQSGGETQVRCRKCACTWTITI